MPCAVILTAHPADYQEICSHLTELQEEIYPQGTMYRLGQLSAETQTWEVAIAEIEVGNASAAIETERALNHFNPDVIILLGVAMGIKKIASGDIVISIKIYGCEVGESESEFYSHPDVYRANYRLLERAKAEKRRISRIVFQKN